VSENPKTELPRWLLPAVSWAASAYFGSGFFFAVGFPPKEELLINHAMSVIACLLFLFLPFLKRVKIGKILELEREVGKTKDDVREFKSEMRSSLALLSTNVNTMVGTQITVNALTSKEVREAEKQGERGLEERIEDKSLPKANAMPLEPIPAVDSPPSQEVLKGKFEERTEDKTLPKANATPLEPFPEVDSPPSQVVLKGKSKGDWHV
jgi:hypothetical protein